MGQMVKDQGHAQLGRTDLAGDLCFQTEFIRRWSGFGGRRQTETQERSQAWGQAPPPNVAEAPK